MTGQSHRQLGRQLPPELSNEAELRLKAALAHARLMQNAGADPKSIAKSMLKKLNKKDSNAT